MHCLARLAFLNLLLVTINGAGGFFWGGGSSSRGTSGSEGDRKERPFDRKQSPDKSEVGSMSSRSGRSQGSRSYFSEDDDTSAKYDSGGVFSGSSFVGSSSVGDRSSKSQRRRDRDADEDYNYETSAMKRDFSEVRKKRKDSDNGFVYDNGELGLDFEHFDDGIGSLVSWTRHLPKLNFNLDPVINFKLKQKISHFGACITLGMDYMSELAQWRAYCAVEDTIVGGRFSLRGSELGWTKSWFMNLGLGEESTAKIKLRMGLNLKSYKAYARVRFRTEPLSSFDIGEGLSCAGKIPLPGLLPILRSIPLRVEYRLRINTPLPEITIRKGKKDGTISLTTGIDRVDLSLDELNFCLEWDERSPVWGIGLVRSGPTRKPSSGSNGSSVKGTMGRQGNKPSASSVPYPA